MNYENASRLILILTMNYAGFMPTDPQSAAVKKGMWADALRKFDVEPALAAIETMLKELKFPPTISDFYEFIGVANADLEREKALNQPMLEDNGPKYTADMNRVDRLMKSLDRELAGIKTFDTGGKNGS